MEQHKFKLKLPDRNGSAEIEEFETNDNIVLVGANGSGKTRMGVKIELGNDEEYKVHRIGAHKKLSIPDSAQFRNLDKAENYFRTGNNLWGLK